VKLKSRLIIAFLIMIAMPVILLSIAAGTIVRFQMSSIHQSYDVEAKILQVITNPTQILNRLTRGVYNQIQLCALKTPEKLEDYSYYEELNRELEGKYSFLAVRKDGSFIYSGNQNGLIKIADTLPEFGSGNTDVDGGIYIGGKNPYLIKSQDFYFSDSAEGTIFVITDLNTLVPQIKNAAIQGVISILLIIIFTAFILIVWIYQSILKPLNILRIATNKIKEGELGYSVQSDSNDEIGQLCEDFEEMRIRLKELIEQRLRHEEDIKELISNISHDLKTPLTAIKGYAEGLADGVAGTKAKQDQYLKTICAKANEISALVDELSYYTRIDCDNVPYSFKDINVKEYFDDCIGDLGLDLELKSIRIEYENEVSPDMYVMADAEQVKRVINNIVSNSIKYMDNEAGVLRISVHDEGEYIRTDIEDNGSGIPEHDIPHIFDRFYRADASRNSNKGGSGLGLAISKKVIEDHGGFIRAASIVGKGTTISFTLQKSSRSYNLTEGRL
jgi:signal transduction histidine kinase